MEFVLLAHKLPSSQIIAAKTVINIVTNAKAHLNVLNVKQVSI